MATGHLTFVLIRPIAKWVFIFMARASSLSRLETRDGLSVVVVSTKNCQFSICEANSKGWHWKKALKTVPQTLSFFSSRPPNCSKQIKYLQKAGQECTWVARHLNELVRYVHEEVSINMWRPHRGSRKTPNLQTRQTGCFVLHMQICRKICGLGCVNHAHARARVTQPSPRSFLNICTDCTVLTILSIHRKIWVQMGLSKIQ